MTKKSQSKKLSDAMCAMMLNAGLTRPPAQASKPRRKRKNRNRKAKNRGTFVPKPKNAPAAMGFTSSMRTSGIFKPQSAFTSDPLAVVQVGTQDMRIIYNEPLAPQLLPPGSRAHEYVHLFAKYKPMSVDIKIISAIPTDAGGQIAAFYDPNPKNNWSNAAAALGALTSMPAKQVAAAWQNIDLSVPKQELKFSIDLSTYEGDAEELVTNFGQLVVVCLAAPTTTPAGAGKVTIWMDANWIFYDPNVSPPEASGESDIAPGTWTMVAGGNITVTPVRTPDLKNKTAYRVFPPLPATFATQSSEYLAIGGDGVLFCFDTEANAVYYARNGGSVGKLLPGTTPSQELPAEIALPISLAKRGIQVIENL